ncbi:glycosyltransferase [Sphingomonas sp. LB3N6]|uniref:glycosyltransferase n=1 Tax=Sphingomonas fucosidasi TaxID=3096164 RepID=UPI002FC85AAD
MTAGYIEALECLTDRTVVQGWANDDALRSGALTLSFDGIAQTVVQIIDTTYREDLAAVDARAFRVCLPVPIGPGTKVTAAIIGASLQIAADAIRPMAPLGHIEVAGSDDIGGWIVAAGLPVTLQFDGTLTATIDAAIDRPDLAQIVPGDAPTYGFRVSLQALRARSRPSSDTALGPDRVLLRAGTHIVGDAAIVRTPLVHGKLERVTPAEARGWAADANRPDGMLQVEMRIDGIRYATGLADRNRADLVAKGIVTAGGGFRFEMPSISMTGGSTAHVAVHARDDAMAIRGGTDMAVPERRSLLPSVILDILPDVDERGVTIIVPIYNAASDTAACIAALRRTTDIPCRLILIDDCSTDPAIAGILETAAALRNVEVHRNTENLGFTRTVNRAIALAGSDDVVLLNSDTQVTTGWLQGLRLAAYSGRSVATATAVSDNAGAFSVPETGMANPVPALLSFDDMARLVRQSAMTLRPEVPTGHGFCLYIRRDALDRIGLLDATAFPRGYGEENDFSMRADHAGLRNVVDDRTFVHHEGSASFGTAKAALYAAGRLVVDARYPEYKARIGVFARGRDMLAMRWRIRRAVAQAVAPPRPRILYVIATQSGGTPQTNQDLMTAIDDRFEPWLLRCDTVQLELSRLHDGALVPVETADLHRGIDPLVHRSSEYDMIVADMLTRHAIELVHIRHMAWHSTTLPQTCRRLGIAVIFSFHDFYMLCPTVKLLDQDMVFCGGRCTPGVGRCRPELWPVDAFPNLKHQFIYRWRAMMSDALRHCDAYVTTSLTARAIIVDALPDLVGRRFEVIPHGRTFTGFTTTVPRHPGAPLRVLVPGNLSAAKGAILVEAVADIDRGRTFEFHVLGDSGHMVARPGLVLHGRYQRDAFAARVAEIAPHVGAIFSIWAETYCHTLTELWAAGLPVIGFDIGAVGDRIKESGAGWLHHVGIPAADLAQWLTHLAALPDAIQAASIATVRWQDTVGRSYDTSAMADRYCDLYAQVAQDRRVFTTVRADGGTT